MSEPRANGNGSYFEFLASPHVHTPEPNDTDLDRWNAIVDAEEVFEQVVAHVARTTFGAGDDLKVRLALSAMLGAWNCVLKAREE